MNRSSPTPTSASVQPLIVLFIVSLVLGGCRDNPISSTAEKTPDAAEMGTSNAASAAAKCDVVVPDNEPTIQDGVVAAKEGRTVCVEPGTYEEKVEVTKNVTLRGRTAPHSGNPAELNGHFSVEPTGAGTTIRRFRITSTEIFEGETFPDPFGVRITGSDVLIENNVIEGLQANLENMEEIASIHGVQIFGQNADVSNVTVRNNVIRGFESTGRAGGIAGVKVQASVDGATIRDNQITDHHSEGWVWGIVLTSSASADGVPTNVTVEENHIAALNDGTVHDVFDAPLEGRGEAPFPGSAFGIDGAAHADEATVTRNNLLAPNGAENKDTANELVAECNWWGDRSGPFNDEHPNSNGTWALEHPKAEIQVSPWLNAPAPSRACIGGTTPGHGRPGHGKGPGKRPGGGPRR